ncbi:MAG: YbaK/EbsC family protein [Myxococcota bacterium]|nr:YbaK/EbsC family protein [Myxococcota bacterium]
MRTVSTSALRILATAGIHPTLHTYRYKSPGGTAASSAALGIDEFKIIKTLIFETIDGIPFVVLMHGTQMVSAKALARRLQVRSVRPCSPVHAQKHSGYQVGGTSPFGMRKVLPVYVESTILKLESILINAGRRGLLMEIEPRLLQELLAATPVEVGMEKV